MLQPDPSPGSEPFGEFGLIAQLRAATPSHPRVPLGIGDDCASIRVESGSEVLVTTDMLMEGRHFLLGETDPVWVGRKALAVNLSDIAAMAGTPLAAFVAVALPRRDATRLARQLHEGIRQVANQYDVALAGGDTNAWDGPLVICVTVVGQTVPPGPVLRSGARPGDVVCVTGPLGGSRLGRHLNPEPRIREALTLHRAVAIRAMIDISDGLAADLGHILEESGGRGAVLDADAIPIHPDAVTLSELDGVSPRDHALHDGEDFELCLTLDPEEAHRVLARPPAEVTLHRIGTITAKPGLWLRRPDGLQERLEPRGFDHFRD